MSSGADLYRFGPFELDAAVPRVRRDGELVALPIRHVLVLLRLVSGVVAPVGTKHSAA